MKTRCGIDIIEVKRIKEAIEKQGDKFLNRVFTNKEIEYCNSRNVVKYEHYAARFAAKEAIFKAISEELQDKYELTWLDIEILNDSNGRPYVSINKEKLKNKEETELEIDISLSHIKEYAIANCIVQINK